MSDIVNLNRARKDKARKEARATAAENRVRFGLAKGEKTLAAKVRDKAARDLDGAKRD